MNQKDRFEAVRGYAARLKFPHLFILVMALLVLDVLIPDPIPFVDEILLGLLAALFGSWRQRRVVEPEPPERDVTPAG